MESQNQRLSIAEMYVIGKKKYGDAKEGLENWKADLLKFVTQEFHESLNSCNYNVQRQANDEIALWSSTTDISYFFRGTWGNEYDNKAKALQYLHHAQLLEHKFNDQIIIHVINQAIKSCLENKYDLLE